MAQHGHDGEAANGRWNIDMELWSVVREKAQGQRSQMLAQRGMREKEQKSKTMGLGHESEPEVRRDEDRVPNKKQNKKRNQN
jgi:hypothetical protein